MMFIEFETLHGSIIRILKSAIIAIEHDPADTRMMYVHVSNRPSAWTVKGAPDALFQTMAGTEDIGGFSFEASHGKVDA